VTSSGDPGGPASNDNSIKQLQSMTIGPTTAASASPARHLPHHQHQFMPYNEGFHYYYLGCTKRDSKQRRAYT
jgi:hypothetical protein